MCNMCEKIQDLIKNIDQQHMTIAYPQVLLVLAELEHANNITLYAGTFSFLEASECYHFNNDMHHYFYCNNCRKGFCLYINRMGFGMHSDDALFKFSHRYLYNRNHLQGRVGTYFNK